MKKLQFLLILLVVGALFVPAVSADKIVSVSDADMPISIGDEYETIVSGESSFSEYYLTNALWTAPLTLYLKNVEACKQFQYAYLDVPGNKLTGVAEGRHIGTYIRPSDNSEQECIIYVTKARNVLNTVTSVSITIFPQDWEVGTKTGVYSQPIKINGAAIVLGEAEARRGSFATLDQGGLFFRTTDTLYGFTPSQVTSTTGFVALDAAKARIDIAKIGGTYKIDAVRVIDGKANRNTVNIVGSGGSILKSDTSAVDKLIGMFDLGSVIAVEVTYPGVDYHKLVVNFGATTHPPVVQPVMRQGTVTMTDNNGTTITGFEVTAANAYTDESYTVATDTDIAVMTLPMDRTIQIRNPQTGVYEEAPVGYYRFYGQSPGYKMLNEDGIQVSVMPEKYGSYQLCDIRVTQESGYLTGKHQFQIRSRSDNSILQSGTISAKSATTGEWYNTTVTSGIASLILPYDTSNVQSQYAGNYYVYATSPGFVDSDYGTQIVVMPHTVSEIHNILLTPIGGIPPAGNVTLRIQVFSETGSGVRNAEIFIAGVHGAGASLWDTYTASSTGYLTVSVPGNSTYDIVASGAGYYDSARRVEVFNEDPCLIEIKLYLSGAPAPTVVPTTQPTGWVTATPTQTTPPIQEDNIIGLSVKGLAKGFGIDYDTALLMFGLMIVFGAGGIVMNSVKGGAMEFIAGSIVGTFIAFALGLIPIWIFIIIAVVFGAYVLRVFIQGGQ